MQTLRFSFPLILSAFWLFLTIPSHAFFGVSFDFFAQPEVSVAPPPLPAYEIPEAPGDDYFWAPGHWSWNGNGYFWVPGTWVESPTIGYLWTPGYWGFNDGRYHWNEGYWGPHVGFYGGVNYGGGYNGRGFNGGSWNGRSYHRSADFSRGSVRASVSFNGGPGGTTARATSAERSAANEHHHGPTQAQVAHATAASRNTALTAAVNHGRPAIAATSRASDLGRSAVAPRKSSPSTGSASPTRHQGNTGKAQSVSRREVKPRAAQRTPQKATRAVRHSNKAAAPRQQRPAVSHASRPQSSPATHSSGDSREKKK